jgi:hypothetical protein
MAINPNTDFTAGAILTADQQNRFGRGVMALSLLTSDLAVTSTEATRASLTFTAVANRYYKITWVENKAVNGVNTLTTTMRIRPTSVATTEIALSEHAMNGSQNYQLQIAIVTTFAAGSVTLFARAQTNFSSITLTAGATAPSFFMVEDIGPA